MNYGELRAAIASYLHREDADDMIRLAIAMTRTRLGNLLRSSANQTAVAFDYQSDGAFLPADYAAMIEVWYPDGGLKQPLQPVTEFQAAVGARLTGTKPTYYSVRGGVIWIRPQIVGTYQIHFYTIPPELVNDTDDNAVLLLYPQLYIYGALTEMGIWAANPELTSLANERWNTDLQQINTMYRMQGVGSVPAMRRV